MRKGFKKNGLIAFTLVSACALTAGAVLAMPNVSASAATANTFEMVEKASVRVTDPAGMRFMVRVSDDVMQTMKNADKAGFLIFPKAYLTADVIKDASYHDKYSAENTDYTGLYDYLDVEIKDDTYYKETDETTGDETGYYLANGVVHTVQEANRQLDYAAIAYYQSGTDYSYANFNGDFSRSLFGVLQKAYITDEEDRAKIQAVDAFDWVGSESYPFQIATAEEYTQFVDSISETNTYQDKFVTLTETITLASGFKQMPTAFAGTMSTATDKKLLFDAQNTTYVSFAEDEYATSIAGVDYDCKNAKIPELSKDLIKVNKNATTTSIVNIIERGDAGFVDHEDTLITGDYQGDTATSWEFAQSYKTYLNVKLDNYDLSTYSYLSVWFAVSNITALSEGGYFQYSASASIMGAKSITPESLDDSGKWVQWQIPIKTLTTYYESKGNIQLFNTYFSGTPSPSRPYLYIGDITLEKETQLPKFTASSDMPLHYYKDADVATRTDSTSLKKIVKASETGITGDYMGEYAIKCGKIYNNHGLYLNIDLNKYDLTGYTHLSVWIACDAIVNTAGYIKIGDTTTMITNNTFLKASDGTAGVWHNYLIPITTLQTHFTNKGYMKICDTYPGNANNANGERAFVYVGDMQFVTVA